MFGKDNVYNSGLNETDWNVLRDAFWPFIHAKDPSRVEILSVPQHLWDHLLMNYVRKYKETGDEKYLDLAGKCLIPSKEPFGWYTPPDKITFHQKGFVRLVEKLKAVPHLSGSHRHRRRNDESFACSVGFCLFGTAQNKITAIAALELLSRLL